jgi:hypothetical protein
LSREPSTAKSKRSKAGRAWPAFERLALVALLTLAPLFALAGIDGVAGAEDGPPVADGLVLFGSILPKPNLVPVMEGLGVPSNFPPGPDVVIGYDARGKQVFRRTFRDKIYNYYVFVQLGRTQLASLQRLRIQLQGRTLETTASAHGAPAARAETVGPERVRITWDARAFPRLACHDEGGGSPAPLMLGGDFTAADVRGDRLRCDFSDGVKTVFHDVPIHIGGTPAR